MFFLMGSFSLVLLHAQPIDLHFQEFNLNDDLSSFSIQCIEQDSMGFMWVGTSNGLFRYDGFELRPYLKDDANDFGIDESHVYSLFNDTYGSLWISLNSHLCRYDIGQDSIEIIASQSKGNGLDNPFVSVFHEGPDSLLYVASGSSVYYFDRKRTGMFQKVASLKGAEITALCTDHQQQLWIGTSGGERLYCLKDSGQQPEPVAIDNEDFPAHPITGLIWRAPYLWIATNGSGVASYLPVSGKLKRYPVDSEYALNVRKIYVDRENILWVLDFTGLKVYVPDRDFFQGYYPETGNPYSIKQHIYIFFQDCSKNYWSAHTPGGLSFCPRPKGFTRFDSHVNSPFRLSVDPVSAIIEDQEGNLWMGNPFNGIDVFYWSRGKTVTYVHDSNNRFSLGKGAVQALFRDSKQRIWVGTYWGGLQYFDQTTERFHSFQNDPADSASISSNDIRSICEDREGNLWICSHGKGLDRFDPETGQFQNFNHAKNNLSNDYTFDVLCDSSNVLWVATAWGVSRLQPGATRFMNYLHDRNNGASLSSNLVMDLFEDRLQRIWLGTSDGLNRYVPEGDFFQRFGDDFPNAYIVSILDDSKNRLWLGTQNGLIRFDPVSGGVLFLGETDGIGSNHFSPRAFFDNGKNTLFLGHQKGITYFSPDSLRFAEPSQEVYITRVKLQNREINHRNSLLIRQNILLVDTLSLDYRENYLSFEFSSLTPSFQKTPHFAYYLDGFEADWNELYGKNEVTYTNLKPGEYRFRVKSQNDSGFWNEPGSSLVLIIAPPFWETIWFRILLLLLLLGAMFGIIKIREERLIRVQSDLERKVEQRTREILLQNELLEKQKQELEEAHSVKNRFFNVLAHDLKSPVSSLVQLTHLLRERMKNGTAADLDRISGLAQQTAEEVHRLLEDLLVWGRAQSKNIQYVFGTFDVNHLVYEVIEICRPMAEAKKIHVTVSLFPEGSIYADKNSMSVIMRNLLVNAIKFSYTGQEVIIESSLNSSDEMVVCISDQGVGIPPEKMDYLFLPKNMPSSMGTAGEKGSGMGLSLCVELVKQNGGKIWAKSTPGKGSRFFVSIPRHPDQLS